MNLQYLINIRRKSKGKIREWFKKMKMKILIKAK